MKYEETRQILSILKTAYPQSFAHWSKEQGESFLHLWSKGLQDENVLDVMVAIWHFIQDTDRDFAPTLGMVRAYISSVPRYCLKNAAEKYFPNMPEINALTSASKQIKGENNNRRSKDAA